MIRPFLTTTRHIAVRRVAVAVAARLAAAASASASATARPFTTATRPLLAGGHPVPQPTAARDPSLKRNPAFAQLTPADIAHFQSILPSASAVLYADGAAVTQDDLLPYNMDWMRKYRGQSSLVLRPSTTAQVSQILKHCHARGLAVVPQGGNTGLVGGSVPVFDEIVLNLTNMNKIRSFDAVSGVITVDAGCILEAVDEHLRKFGHMMPLDLGAKGSCQIGGNLATNAGGLRVLRYGSLRGSVLGVEAVLPNGDILDTLVPLRKDNTGLDLKQLMIGAEGTLGVITAASILAPVRPNATHVAVVAVPDYAGVQKAFLNARTMLGETLSAFEFWDSNACELIDQHLSHVRHPLETQGGGVFNVLVETAGADAEHNMAKLDAYLEKLMEDGVAVDGAVAQDQAQAMAIWAVREGIPEACSKAGAVFKYDVSVPVPDLYELVEATRARLADLKVPGVLSVIGYGHVGDGNLHLNVAAEDYTKEVTRALEPFVYEWVAGKRGSISAEHGLGLMKPKHLHYSKTKAAIDLMQQIKKVVDPKGIMNPYKYLPEPESKSI